MSDSTEDNGTVAERAIRLAVEIGERGLKAVNEFMERDRADLDRAIRLSAESMKSTTTMITGATEAQQDARRDALTDAEEAVVKLVRAVAPHATLAAARIVTGDTKLRDQGWHTNTVTAMREVARLATSLINESVGAGDPARGPAGPRDVVNVVVDVKATSVEVELVNEDWPRSTEAPSSVDVDILVTPLTADAHVIPVPSTSVQLVQNAESASVKLDLPEPLRSGTYGAWMYAIAAKRVLASAELVLTVSAAAKRDAATRS
jgi:hypothetical protein